MTRFFPLLLVILLGCQEEIEECEYFFNEAGAAFCATAWPEISASTAVYTEPGWAGYNVDVVSGGIPSDAMEEIVMDEVVFDLYVSENISVQDLEEVLMVDEDAIVNIEQGEDDHLILRVSGAMDEPIINFPDMGSDWTVKSVNLAFAYGDLADDPNDGNYFRVGLHRYQSWSVGDEEVPSVDLLLDGVPFTARF